MENAFVIEGETSTAILFYDIPSRSGKSNQNRAWSPNTWKIRFALNYKGLPYKTVWVEYPDIERVSKEIGAAPTAIKTDGSPMYTLPLIYDPYTKATISDSLAIARYLDETYPETPVLIPPGTAALHAAFDVAYKQLVAVPMFPINIPAAYKQLNPVSQVYFRSTKEALYGKLEDWSPAGSIKRTEHWKKVREGYSELSKWMAENGEGVFMMGQSMSFADIMIAGYLEQLKRVVGTDSEEWIGIMSWDGGRWFTFMREFEKFETIDY